ncbi:hypothetical protein [Pseudoalteromonas luteoviolacea]|uniref:Uncharacterized protein n=1 Tax=Pseudoalteromonas luteoviolacea S4060-1 TaxID=1365257 RepID=A0A162BT64_9GAMM|nr:hypothetical protein [Pseudoalteromonas luteoviolacea]KZN34739.1 hypothetical protein N480_20870 [Pseudoalteromonas luteoviolacea S2607]KZN68078.1 hypothetical protein N478_15760 [Pseudoalteromonas luteoviolacea S4060-1]
MFTPLHPVETYMVFTYIRISLATDALGLPSNHPLYHRHASLVLRNNLDGRWFAYGFGFTGFCSEPIPRKAKVYARELVAKRMSVAQIDKLFIKLNQGKSVHYDIAKYNCVDHLIVGLRAIGKRSKLLSHYRYMNRAWYKNSEYLKG